MIPVIVLAALLAALCLTLGGNVASQTGGAQPAAAAVAKDRTTVHVGEWLRLGPLPCPAPAFSSEGREKYDSTKLLAYDELSTEKMKPAAGKAETLPYGAPAVWRTVTCDTSGAGLPVDAKEPAVAYLAAYVEVPRWMKIGVEARSSAAFELLIDNAEVAKGGPGSKFTEKKTGEAKLERGKHLLIVKGACSPADSVKDWRIDVSVTAAAGASPALSLSSERDLALRDMSDLVRIGSVAVAPDGSVFAAAMSAYRPSDGKSRSWVEIRRTADGSLLRTMKDVAGLSNIQWCPVGKRLSYAVSGAEGKRSLRLLDLETGAVETVLEDVKDLDGYSWAPSGAFIVYSVTERPEPDKSGLQRVSTLEERRSDGKERSYLYLAAVPGGATRRLTAGKNSASVADFHPDGRHILFTRNYEDLSERPYDTWEILTLNLEDGSVDLLWKGHWLNGAAYSPDGSKLLVVAGPSAFGDIGKTVSADMIPNDYDWQLYLFDPATKKAEALSRDFDRTIDDAFWSKVDGNIYLTVEEGSYRNLYRYVPKKRAFQRIEVGCEVIEQGDIARSKLAAVYGGSGATQPKRLYAVDLARGASRMIYDPWADDLAGVRQGAVESWSFTTKSGTTIDGYFYLPPSFDPQKKYPCIVYYYGGTMPVTRNFGGSYPKNLWAAHGYVVYVPQPSGATGYGQKFSARHVNDWGKVVCDEIIEGATRFADAHPFVDRTKIGCVGASYGGFMTELLVTRTDMFAAAVSHAGISSIASYWGAGYWGYGYSAVATANSFPWNRKDIYVDQSPLFAADRVKTPILLLHGTEDTNVPTNESEQFFTALKLLGKTVEYVRVEGENHGIMEYNKRRLWMRTTLAWFDRWLKGEPDWWNDLYPPAAGAETGPAAKPEERPPATAPTDIGVAAVARKDGSRVLVGKVTREDIVGNIAGWDEEYFTYQPNDTIIGELSGRLDGVKILVVLGTWCSDSHREVPRLWKVLETIGFPRENLTMLAVLSARAAADSTLSLELVDWSRNARDYYGIKAVESVIVYRGGVEIGRFVEAPAKSIEADLLEILKK